MTRILSLCRRVVNGKLSSNVDLKQLQLNPIANHNQILQFKRNLATNPATLDPHQLKCVEVEPTITQKLTDLKDYYKQKAADVTVNPRSVFANNELDLGNYFRLIAVKLLTQLKYRIKISADISVYGFDYDYTLAVYKQSLDYLIVKTCAHFVN